MNCSTGFIAEQSLFVSINALLLFWFARAEWRAREHIPPAFAKKPLACSVDVKAVLRRIGILLAAANTVAWVDPGQTSRSCSALLSSFAVLCMQWPLAGCFRWACASSSATSFRYDSHLACRWFADRAHRACRPR